jgi:hypothetical protein
MVVRSHIRIERQESWVFLLRMIIATLCMTTMMVRVAKAAGHSIRRSLDDCPTCV